MSGILVTVVETKGSTPREVGASMLVTATGQEGTIGGGELEWRATALARARLGREVDELVSLPLGPELGQCCGGLVRLRLQTAEALPAPRALLAPVWLFGAGHVGRAVAHVLRTLPGQEIVWIDERAAALPASDARTTCIPAAIPEALVSKAPAGAHILVMTHSHPRDLAIVAAALGRNDLGLVGLIGSATKRARFERRLRGVGLGDAALARLSCPIGLPTVRGKHPSVVAIAVVAQLLETRTHG
ncbi:MAG: xanthine dehydrogenase accessory protein XdhC [Pseudomonadota bacterium]